MHLLLDLHSAHLWTQRLFALSVTIQVVELWALAPRLASSSSPWNWALLGRDYESSPLFLQSILRFSFEKHFTKLLLFFALCGIGISTGYGPFYIFWCSIYLLIQIRFRGVFNGGSDYMTWIVFSGLTLITLSPKDSFHLHLGLHYIAVISTWSYFMAGLVKLKHPDWRNGKALFSFIAMSNYFIPSLFQSLLKFPKFLRAASWFVILWECAFPLVWIWPSLTFYFLSLGLVFHLLNFWIFGINRFVWAWLASYPALLYCTKPI